MATLVFSFVVVVMIVTAMAVGVLLGRKPISGSCGGMKALGMDMACEICSGDQQKCETTSRKPTGSGQKSASAADLSSRVGR